jgi:phosphoserine phosphatase RsbU/P
MSNGFGPRSLAAKLVYLMSAVICGTVLALTIQSASKFSAYIQQNIEESSTILAERTATDIAAIIESWFSQMAVAVSKLPTAAPNGPKDDSGLTTALRANKDILAINLYAVKDGKIDLIRHAAQTAKTPTITADKASFDKKIQSYMDTTITELVANPGQFTDSRFVMNATPQLNAPSIFMAIKLSMPGISNRYAVIGFVADMTKLQLMLPQSRHMSAYITDYTGKAFISSDEMIIASKSKLKQNNLLKKALTRREPSGFVDKFLDHTDREKIGSFSQLPGNLPFVVIVERDRAAAFQVVSRVYFSSALWGLLILLLATLMGYLSAGSITKNLRNLVAATYRIATGDFSVRLQPKTRDEVALLSHSVNNMASKIQTLMTSEVEKARFEKELETARLVQSTFFPKHDIKRPHLLLTGSYQPATECGGDLWGHYTIREDVELVFIADAMGHGAPAALVTAIAYAICQSVSKMLTETAGIDASPSQLLNRLNQIIYSAVGGKITMTFFAGLIDFRRGTMTYANAGHNFPFILSANKDDTRLSAAVKRAAGSNSTYPITLTLKGNPLGGAPDNEYTEKTMTLVAGDKIVFFTDGLIENCHKGNEPLGRKALIETACSVGLNDPSAIRSALENRGSEIYGTAQLADDVTIVIAEISKQWIPQTSQATDLQQNAPASHNINSATEEPSFKLVDVPPPPPRKVVLQENESADGPGFELTTFDLSEKNSEHVAESKNPNAGEPSNASMVAQFNLGTSNNLDQESDTVEDETTPGDNRRVPSAG